MLDQIGIGPVGVRPANDPVDLDVAGHPVELKVSRAHAQPSGRKTTRFQAELRGKRHGLNGNLLILLCVDRDDRLWPYIIPVRELADQRTIEITSHPTRYRGKWRRYLRAWDLLQEGTS